MEDPILADLVAQHLDVHPSEIRLERCSTGKHNQAWFVGTREQSLVLRVAPPDAPSSMLFYEYRMMRQEPDLHRLLRQRTDLPVPEIIAFDFDQERIGRDYLLMERLPGTPLSDQPLDQRSLQRVLRQVGQSLRAVHAITGDQYGYNGAHQPMQPQPDWASAFTIMWNKLLDDIERCGGYSPDEAGFMRQRLDEHLSVFATRCVGWQVTLGGYTHIELHDQTAAIQSLPGPAQDEDDSGEAPPRLAFDVTDQPAPMFELSPYRHVRPPHLHGYLRSNRGEFLLTRWPDGATRLEGRTWYEFEMFPQWYWTLWSDLFIHRIHERVLKHVKQLAEERRDQ